MLDLNRMIRRYIAHITSFIIIIILIVAYSVYLSNAQATARERSASMFVQIDQLLTKNEVELEEVETEYSETCIHNARAIAYLLERTPELINDTDELRKIAEYMEVDEIHIFDKTGRIYAGTHPEYYNYTFDSGEQMMFFKPLLTDKSLTLVQDITPNTADAKNMQYSALWSEHEKFILQVGMEPSAVMETTENNEISYIFSMLKVDMGVNCYAIDMESGDIVGSTAANTVGLHFSDVGFQENELLHKQNGFHSTINGTTSYCVFTEIHGYLVGRTISIDVLYADTLNSVIGLIICCIFLTWIEIHAVTKYMNRYVVGEIHAVNTKLCSISLGNLDENVDVRNSLEFVELSDHINAMVSSLLSNNKKLSYVLSQTNMYIGVYEYGKQKKVRITEYVPQILGLDKQQVVDLTADYNAFKAFIEQLQEHPLANEENIFALSENHYVRLNEICENNEVFGVVIDMTEEILKRKQAEADRDIDALTGLYNRRGMEIQLSSLFKEIHELKHGALIMIDADGLKNINDQYGHDCGDIYLKKIAKIINGFGISSCLAARMGGDEFVLFLYHYDSKEELIRTIDTLQYIQNSSTVHLMDNVNVPLRFSYGYTLLDERTDYRELIKESDEKMYANKRIRKAQM